jgi:hypothetical protein
LVSLQGGSREPAELMRLRETNCPVSAKPRLIQHDLARREKRTADMA